MIPEIIVFIAFIFFSCLYGVYDGMMWYLARENVDPMPKPHPHVIALWMRILVAVALALLISDSWLQSANYSVALGLVFSFWHNGFYYETRKRLDKPKGYWFFGQSTTSTGKWEFNGPVRSVMFFAGFLMYFFLKI